MDFFKKIAAVVIGLFAGSIILTISDYFIGLTYPLPDFILPEDKSAISEHEINAPVYIHVVRMIFWAIVGFVAGWVATRLAPVMKPTYAYFCGLIFLCASVFYMVTHQSEWWIWVGALIIWIPASHIGYLLAAK